MIFLKFANFISESFFVLSGSIIFESKKTSTFMYVLTKAFFPSMNIDDKITTRKEIANIIPSNPKNLKVFSDLFLLIRDLFIFSKLLIILFSIFFNYL